MFVVFEGIDGSGKTTVSSKVAKALRKRGITIEHVREDGVFSSPLVSRMREFGKDSRNLALGPLAELMFYCARDAQLSSECIRPALDRGAVVFADRYLYSHQVLAEHGRGLPESQVRPIVNALAGGLWPDLVVLLDVDPFLARIRRRVAKLMRKAEPRRASKGPPGGSRKGLGGVAVQHRVRAGYLALAEADRERWLVVDNGGDAGDHAARPKLKAIAEKIADVIAAMWQGHLPGDSTWPVLARSRPRSIAVPGSFDEGRDRFYQLTRDRAEREIDVAAYLLAGLDDDRAYGQRRVLAEEAPHAVAYGLRGLIDDRAWALRDELRHDAPYHVARSLSGPAGEDERAEAMRESLAESQPEAVLTTLSGNAGEAAWRVRDRFTALDQHHGDLAMHDHNLYAGPIVASLARLDDERAWALRDRLAAAIAARSERHEPVGEDVRLVAQLVESVTGLSSEAAWTIRRRYLELVPVAVLASLVDVHDEHAWSLRHRYVEYAPAMVMASLARSNDARAYALRAAHAERVKEALDSMIGLDDERAWALRLKLCELWPSTVVKSLGSLGLTPRGRELALALLARHPTNVSLLKHITRLAGMADAQARQAEATRTTRQARPGDSEPGEPDADDDDTRRIAGETGTVEEGRDHAS